MNLGKTIRNSLFFISLAAASVNAQSAKIIAAGDVMLGRDLNSEKIYPFQNLEGILKSADIVICNLEAPFTLKDKKLPKEISFKANPENADYLKRAGFDVVNLANNHAMDYQAEGLIDTLEILDKSGIAYCGAGINIENAREIKFIEQNGIKFAFLGYTSTYPESMYASSKKAGVAYVKEEWIREDVKKAKNLADIVVVSLHSGVEKNYSPTEKQKKLARLAIDSGANIVLGPHPHVLEGIEKYHDGLIAYSLGNFVFGTKGSAIKESALLEIEVSANKIENYNFIPLDVSDGYRHQPKVAEGKTKNAILRNIKKYSEYIK
jgi:poly-gamma-glutamate synthesis protein (capsule biosynthesis protein)